MPRHYFHHNSANSKLVCSKKSAHFVQLNSFHFVSIAAATPQNDHHWCQFLSDFTICINVRLSFQGLHNKLYSEPGEIINLARKSSPRLRERGAHTKNALLGASRLWLNLRFVHLRERASKRESEWRYSARESNLNGTWRCAPRRAAAHPRGNPCGLRAAEAASAAAGPGPQRTRVEQVAAFAHSRPLSLGRRHLRWHRRD